MSNLLSVQCVEASHQAAWTIRKISCTWMTRQRLPAGLWLGHKLPFNRLTPHLAPKADWRVPGVEVGLGSLPLLAVKDGRLIRQPFPSRRVPERTMRCSPFQKQWLFVRAVRNNVCHSEACVFKRGLPPSSSCKTALFLQNLKILKWSLNGLILLKNTISLFTSEHRKVECIGFLFQQEAVKPD